MPLLVEWEIVPMRVAMTSTFQLGISTTQVPSDPRHPAARLTRNDWASKADPLA